MDQLKSEELGSLVAIFDVVFGTVDPKESLVNKNLGSLTTWRNEPRYTLGDSALAIVPWAQSPAGVCPRYILSDSALAQSPGTIAVGPRVFGRFRLEDSTGLQKSSLGEI
ncbi:hypothetical protein L6452_15940 [Arctium lappa]|uniref:Uncharacterized protein n=1 Tax=Arctium lappa TaxID=4217 RepID=A0ACB9CQA1_ARCLA|nr:hypothetical protein L6452_15940 [Arctium lappa]